MARKILLADDSVTAQNMGRKILTDAGYDVITVNNGSAALKRVAEQKPDLIVLDVYMPGYSGLEVCVRLKEAPETSRIPILLTVGKLEPFKPEEANRVRADGFIVKPFEASELLSALTRLEDRIVPAQAESGRFSSSVSGVERFNGGDPSVTKSGGDDVDSGWKNRLRFPSKKKKEEPEPEPEPDFVTPSSFRDFRRGGGKAPEGTSPFPLSTAPAAQAPEVVPDIPRDITPEELDALSELAAKLDGAATAGHVAAVSTETASSETPAALATAGAETAPEPEAEIHASSTPVDGRTEPEVSHASTASPEVDLPPTSFAVAAPEDAAEVAVSADPMPPVPVVPEEIVYPTIAAIAQEPAPIDRDDEPAFASAVSAEEQVSPEPEKEPEVPEIAEPVATAVAAEEGSSPEQPIREATAETVAQSETNSIEQATPPPDTGSVAVSSSARAAAEGSSPSAEELAEALRFLTPQPAVPSNWAEAGAALAKELSQGATGRWVAESVPLSAEESAGSLEAEMFRTFASSGKEATSSSNASAETPAVAVSEAAEVHIEPSTKTTENPVEESQAPTTFAEAASGEELPAASASTETATDTTAKTESPAEISSSANGPGGEEDMAKEPKGKSGKSNGDEIRSGAPATNALDAAKQSQEAPKAMAATASADNGSDAGQIASIVDSVLADLRPKIVEEIARQLSKK